MKKIFSILSLAAFIFAGISANAQVVTAQKSNPNHPECSREHSHNSGSPILTPKAINMLKEEYLKSNLSFPEKELNAFWKYYKRLEDNKLKACENAKAAMEKAGIPTDQCCKEGKPAKLTDEQKVSAHQIMLQKHQDILSAEQQFFKELLKNFTTEQVAQYLQLEKDFEKELSVIQEKEERMRSGENRKEEPSPAKRGESFQKREPQPIKVQ